MTRNEQKLTTDNHYAALLLDGVVAGVVAGYGTVNWYCISASWRVPILSTTVHGHSVLCGAIMNVSTYSTVQSTETEYCIQYVLRSVLITGGATTHDARTLLRGMNDCTVYLQHYARKDWRGGRVCNRNKKGRRNSSQRTEAT